MDDIKALNTRLGSEWYLLGIELGFTNSQLEHLQNAYPYNIPQCISTLLNNWVKVVQSEKADPLPILRTALRNINRNDLAEGFIGKDEVDGPFGGSFGTGLLERLKKIRFGRVHSSSIQKYIDQSSHYLEQKLKTKHLFVPTNALRQVVSWYQNCHSVLITGNPGDGKSSIAYHLLSKLQKDGSTVVVLSDPALIEQVYDPKLHIIYFIDDAFGSPTMKHSLVDVWKRLHDKLHGLVQGHKCGLILTSRKLVYKKCSKLFQNCPCYTENIVDITEEPFTLSAVEKNMITAKYFHQTGNIRLANNLKFTNATYIPGFPLLCKMYSTNKGLQKQSDFFDKPLTYMKEEMEALIHTDKASLCSLVIMTVLDGKLSKDIFDPFEEIDDTLQKKIDTVMKAYGLDPSKDLQVVESSIESMVGVYIDEQSEHYVFLHDVIFDTICLIFGQKSPTEVVRIASAEFISKRVRTQYASKITGEKDVIILPKNKNKNLAKRWIQDLKDKHISAVYDNPSFLDKYMFEDFLEEVQKLSNSDLWSLLTSKDIKRGKTYLLLVCRAGFEYLAINMVERLGHGSHPDITFEGQEAIDLSLYEVAEAGYSGVAESLLKLDIANVNQTFGPTRRRCIHNAIINGDDGMTKVLLNYRAAFNTCDNYGVKPIHYACKSGNVKCLKALIENGAKLLSYDSSGKVPAHYACNGDNKDCVKYLYNSGADFNVADFTGNYPIHLAAENKCTKILDYLLEKGVPANVSNSKLMTPLHFACRGCVVQNLDRLLKCGLDVTQTDIHVNSALHMACKGGNRERYNGFECVQLLLNIPDKVKVNAINNASVTPLHEACKWRGDQAFDVVQLLLENGADPNISDSFDQYPLLSACSVDSNRTVKLLLEYKADPNVKGVKGRFPIHYASAKCGPELLTLLMNSGTDLNTKDSNGKQPLHVTCQYGNDNCTAFLIDNGVDVNIVDSDGMTPLHIACKWSKASTVQILLEHGADPDIRTKEGLKPEDMLPRWNIQSLSCTRIKEYLQKKQSIV